MFIAGTLATFALYGMIDTLFFNRIITRFMVRVPIETVEKIYASIQTFTKSTHS